MKVQQGQSKSQLTTDTDEALYRTLIEYSSDAIIIINRQGFAQFANPAAEWLLGYTREELGSVRFQSLIHPDDRAEIDRYYTDLLQTRDQVVSTQFRIQHKNGLWRLLENNARLLPNGEIASYSRDITYYKEIGENLRRLNEELEKRVVERTAQLETALAQSQRLTAIIEATPDMVGIADMQGNLVYMNHSSRRRLGFGQEEDISGVNMADIFTPAAFEEIINTHVPAILAQQAPASYETVFRARDGHTFPAWMVGIIHYTPNGTPHLMAGVARDITERKQAEEALRQSEERFRMIVDAAALDAVVTLDSQGVITGWNSRAKAMFGWSRGEILGQAAAETIIPPRYRKAHQRGLAHFLATGKGSILNRMIEISALHQNGHEFPIEMTITPLKSGQEFTFSAFIRDISERKQADEALAQAKEAAEAANRAKSEFLANMSHELRTPLNAILGFAQLMNRTGNRPADDRENLQTIITSGQHLLSLINDVLEMSKIEAGRATLDEDDFDLYHLLDNLEDLFQLRAQEKKLALTFTRSADVPQYIRTDERKLRQVLINLLGNAMKFTDSGAVTLRVKTNNEHGMINDEFSASVHHSSFITLHFEVEDTGIGISPAEQGNLFQPFKQTSSGRHAQEGSGLGLLLSRRFVQLMGGDITIHSNGIPGQGSVFTFTVRAAPSESGVAQAQPAHRVIALVPGQPQYRILVVEDKDINRRLLVKMLEPLGFEVREAANGQEAVDIFEAWQPHLIWMDMRMPVMDGYEATQRIRASTKGQAPVIIALTASAFEEQRVVVLSAGCDDFVRKPFNEFDLFDKMTEYLGVQFEYEEVSGSDLVLAGRAESLENLKSKIQNLKSNWLAEFYHAAARAQSKTLLDLINQIQPDQPDLATTLFEMVHNFEFEKLKMLVESSPRHKKSF